MIEEAPEALQSPYASILNSPNKVGKVTETSLKKAVATCLYVQTIVKASLKLRKGTKYVFGLKVTGKLLLIW